MAQTIRVLLVDNHKLTCTAVRSIISDAADIILLDEIATIAEAQELYARYKPDILLLSLDIVNKFSDGTLNIAPDAKIILIATTSMDCCRSKLMGKNVCGCILRDQIPDEVIPVIRCVMVGVTCYSQVVARQLTQLQSEQLFLENTAELTELTVREKEVLCLIVDGLTNGHIAFQLKISKPTVEFHVSNIFKKLSVNSRTAAAVWAKTNYLV